MDYMRGSVIPIESYQEWAIAQLIRYMTVCHQVRALLYLCKEGRPKWFKMTVLILLTDKDDSFPKIV